MAKTNIGWTDDSWNPLRYRLMENHVKDTVEGANIVLAGRWGYHCEKISPGCANCYAEAINRRTLPSMGTGLQFLPKNTPKVAPFIDDAVFAAPLQWKRPRMVFPFSMTDLFGAWVPGELQIRLMRRMHEASAHTFQVLTKRPDIAVRFMEDYVKVWGIPPNVWIGASVENALMAEQRMPWLIVCPAAKRFVSYEPALELVDFKKWLPYIQWGIIGGESGAGARGFDVRWAGSAIEDFAAAGVPLFVKQLGKKPYISAVSEADLFAWDMPGYTANGSDFLLHQIFNFGKFDDPKLWAPYLRVQQMPEGFAIKSKGKEA